MKQQSRITRLFLWALTMSDVINDASIKVSIDADSVEVGLRRIDEASAKTGRTLDNLGKSNSFRSLGDGADASSAKVDRTTKNLAESIQRATAAMSAGTKGSAEYYAALANSRGASLATLRPYLDQLDAVTKKTALAAQAQKQLEDGSKFLDSLRSQADGIGKTAAQLAALRAEQLGVADAAKPLIEQLQAAEEAAGGAESSFGAFASALAAVGVTAGVSSIVQLSDQYDQYVSKLRLATDGQTEFVNAQANVRRIATAAQSDLSSTAGLYANITTGVRELGLAQTAVANITETVSLALKVSGASGETAAGAIQQLSQAFASGTLRGDEFNSVNEAAPRLMQALADGLGVPVGALRKLAEEGKLTTAVLADALPRSLSALKEEGKDFDTVAGAATVLKNNVLEMVGATAQSSGAISLLTRGIGLLADNLGLAAGAMATVVSVKLGTSLAASAQAALSSVAANRALAASNVATAQSNVAATATASTLAAARVAELRASVLAAEGTVALAIATNGLIPAQARAAAAAAAHTAALSAQAAAMGAASATTTLLRGGLALLGGPIGAVIAVLGTAATAWAVWGSSSKAGEQAATEAVRASTPEILEGIQKQIDKLRERNRLAKLGFKPDDPVVPAVDRRNEVLLQLDRAAKGTGEYVNLSLASRTAILEALGKQYGQLTDKIEEFNRESGEDSVNKAARATSEGMSKYATNLEKMNAELEKYRKENALTPELEARIRSQFQERSKGLNSQVEAYKSLAQAARERVDMTAREASGLAPLTEAAKLQARLDNEIATGKVKLTSSQQSYLQSLLSEATANEEVAASRKRAEQAGADMAKLLKDRAEAAERAITDLTKEADRNVELAAAVGKTRAEIENLTIARIEDDLAQRKSNALTQEQIDLLERELVQRKRSRDALRDKDTKEAAIKANESLIAEWKRTVDKYDDVFRTGFADMLNNGKNGWSAFTKSLTTTFKTTVADQIYKMFAQPFVVRIVASLIGVTGGSSVAQAAQLAGGESGAGAGIGGIVSAAKAAYSAISTGFSGISTAVADGVQGLLYQSGATTQIASNGAFASGAGSAASIGAGVAAGVFGGRAISGGYGVGGSGNGTVNTGTAIGALVGSIIPGLGTALGSALGGLIGGGVNRLFGRKAREYSDSTIRGSFGADGFSGTTDTPWLEKGGVFRSDKRGVQQDAIGAGIADTFTGGYEAIKRSTSDFAAVLGLNADRLKTRTQALSIALTNDQAENEKRIAAFFTGVADTVAKEVLPNLSTFAKKGEAASATLQRIASDYAFLDVALAAIGKSLGAVGLASVSSRERLLDLVGGIEAFGKGTAFFAQNFLTEAERIAPVAEQVKAALAGLGLSFVDTRDEFKQLVLGLDLNSADGAKTYAALMKIQEAFAQVYPAAESANDALTERMALQKEFDDLTLSAAQQLAKQRNAVRADNRGLFDQVQSAKALKAAQDAAKSSLGDMISKMRSFGESVRSLRDGLKVGDLSTLTPEQKYEETRRQYESTLSAARGGDATAQGNFSSIATAFLEASQRINGGDASYASDFSSVLNVTGELEKWPQDQIDVSQASLNTLNAQLAQLSQLNESVLLLTDQGVGSLVPPPPRPFSEGPNYAAMGTLDMAPMAAEIRALRAEVASLRSDQAQQTGDLINSNAQVTLMAARQGVDGVERAMTNQSWQAQNRKAGLD